MKRTRFFQLLFAILFCSPAISIFASANPPLKGDGNNGPTAVCDDPPTVNLDANGAATIQVSDIFHFTGEGLTYSETELHFNCSQVGIPQTRTVTVTDVNGLTASCTKTFTVADPTTPTMICKTLTVGVTGLVDIPLEHADLVETLSDNCSISIVPNTFTAGCSTLGSHTVTVLAQNLQGNTFSCNATVNVIEAIPALACRSILVYLDDYGMTSVTPGELVLPLGDLGCGGAATLSASQTNFTCANAGSNSVTVTATANSGGTTTCTATVLILPGPTPPITCHDITVSLNAAGFAVVGDIAEAQNGCNYFIQNDPPIVTCADLGQIQVTATLENSCTATVTVIDELPPTILCKNISVNLSAGGSVSITPADVFFAGSDNCGAANPASVSPNNFTCVNAGANTVTLTANDGHGNTATCTATVTVTETIPPAVTCKSISVNLGSTNNVTISTAAVYDAGSDNCGGIVAPISVEPHTFTCANVGANTVTLTASDQSGNTATCTATVVVTETGLPTITCPANTTVAANATCSGTVGSYAPVSKSDNCAPAANITVTQSPAANTGLSGHNDTETITLTANDGNGNTASCSFTVTLNDVTLPTITCPAASTVTCASQIPAVNLNAVTAADNCGPVTKSHLNDSAPYQQTCDNRFKINRIYKAQDEAGNTRTCSQLITVADNTKPLFTSVPANVTVQCDAVPSPGTAIATDGCGAVSVNYDGQTISNTACADTYVITRKWTAADACGNTRTATQRITVQDTQKPVFTTVPANTAIQCSDPVPGVQQAAASDNCDASVTVTYLGQSSYAGNCSNSYQITRTWKATDNCGNWTTAVQIISVMDTQAPTFTSVPAHLTIECDQPVPFVGQAEATDACAGYVQVTFLGQSNTAGDCLQEHILTRTWRATDECGNSVTATQTITVQDTQAPVFSDAPANLTIACGANLPDVALVTAQDNCDTYVPVTYLGEENDGPNCPYTVTRTWEVEDDCDNVRTYTQTITVTSQNLGGQGSDMRSAPNNLELQTLNFELFPNPTTDKVWIDLTGFVDEVTTVAIFNDQGQLIWEKRLDAKEEQRISISLREAGAATGMYTVRVQGLSSLVAKRLVLAE